MSEAKAAPRAMLEDQEREFVSLRDQAHDIRVYL